MKFIFFFSLSNVIFVPAGTVRRVTLGVEAREERVGRSESDRHDAVAVTTVCYRRRGRTRRGFCAAAAKENRRTPNARALWRLDRVSYRCRPDGGAVSHTLRARTVVRSSGVSVFVDPRVPVACAHFRVYTRASRCGAVQRDWYSARKKFACTPFLRVVT